MITFNLKRCGGSGGALNLSKSYSSKMRLQEGGREDNLKNTLERGGPGETQ